MTTNRVLAAGLGLGLIATACQGGFLGLGGDRNSDFRTDRVRYTLQPAPGGMEVAIPFTYTNRGGRTIYVANCNRIAPPHLEKKVGDRWVFAWAAAVPECLSEPILIADGETHTDTLLVFHGDPDVYPGFTALPVDGTYRLVWEAAYWSYDPNRYPFGERLPLRLRVSNSFLIETPGEG